MKNQNDLIFSIVAIVVFLIAFFVCYGTKPEPVRPGAPAPVNLTEPVLPSGTAPVMANSLPGGSSNTGGGGGMGSFGPGPGAAGGQSKTGAPAGSGKAAGLPSLSKGMG